MIGGYGAELPKAKVAQGSIAAYDDLDVSTPRTPSVPDYDLLRAYLAAQTKDEFVLTMDAIEEIIDDALPRASQRASWWETERSPQEKMPQREACLEAGYIATRQADGKSVKFRKMKARR